MFTGVADLTREVYPHHIPLFSFYTGSDMADVPMPTTDDWATAIQAYLPRTVGFLPRQDPTTLSWDGLSTGRAVFRGAATGAGVSADTNPRLRLVQFARARPDLVDAGVTGLNVRDRVVRCTEDAMVVDFFRNPDKVVPVPFMPLDDQRQRFHFLLYVDGHCAASRYGTLMTSGRVILKVTSTQGRTCGNLWLFRDLVGARINPRGHPDTGLDLCPDVDHFIVDPDLGNLEATILWLRAREDVCRACAVAAWRRAPTVSSITSYWAQQLCAAATGGRTSSQRPLFDPMDRVYVSIFVLDTFSLGQTDPDIVFGLVVVKIVQIRRLVYSVSWLVSHPTVGNLWWSTDNHAQKRICSLWCISEPGCTLQEEGSGCPETQHQEGRRRSEAW